MSSSTIAACTTSYLVVLGLFGLLEYILKHEIEKYSKRVEKANYVAKLLKIILCSIPIKQNGRSSVLPSIFESAIKL